MPEIEIDAIKQNFINEIKPLRIYLFGSYAAGTEKADCRSKSRMVGRTAALLLTMMLKTLQI